MKTLVMFVTVMNVAMTIYGLNVERLQKFKDDTVTCTQKFGGSSSNLTNEAHYCLLNNNRMINENGMFIKEEGSQAIQDFISDPDKIKQARTIADQCYDNAMKGEDNSQKKTMKIVECSLPITYLVLQE